MSDSTPTRQHDQAIAFRLEVDGELSEQWAAWFRADAVTVTSGRTVIQLSVADEAELHGLLRRVHDLHLRLFSLTRVGEGDR